jgi:antitoxin (DNA-binding transcriptional repressor) of toxin-antitoxin stability system
MKNASVRQVRHEFTKVMGWVRDGESVSVSKRGEVIALISPPPPAKKARRRRPDFAARLRRIFGASAFSENIIVADRAD